MIDSLNDCGYKVLAAQVNSRVEEMLLNRAAGPGIQLSKGRSLLPLRPPCQRFPS